MQPCFSSLINSLVMSLETRCAIQRLFSLLKPTFMLQKLTSIFNSHGPQRFRQSVQTVVSSDMIYLHVSFRPPSLQAWPSSVLLMSRNSTGCGDVLEAGPQRDHCICPSVASEERPTHNRYICTFACVYRAVFNIRDSNMFFIILALYL